MSRRSSTTSAETARQRAEQQHREIEAGSSGSREPDAPQPQAPDDPRPLYVGHFCRDHPSKRVEPRTGECLLCKLNPVRRELRREMFDQAAAPPAKPRLV